MIKFAKAPVDGGRGVSAVVFMALAAMLCASAPAASCTWTNNVVNTPATAYNWSDSGNWKDGMVPNAYDKAVLPSTALYINLPDGVVASNVSIGATYLMGSKLRIEGNVSGIRPGLSAANGCLFADLELGKLNGLDPWISSTGNGINIAGRTIAVDAHYIPAGGTISQRLDYFANSSNPVRTDDIQIAADKMFFPGSASCMVFAPKGSAECTGTWSQTAGSPFISLVGASHTLAVGTIVTGDGIPDYWEVAHGMDPHNADQNGNGVPDGQDDFDGDGLNNWYEFLADTDPFDRTTDGVSVDANVDSDNDGLTNGQEQQYGTHPLFADTDDDGWLDGYEVNFGSNPLDAADPFRPHAVRFQGEVNRLVSKPLARYTVNGSFTLSAMVRPTAFLGNDAMIVSHANPDDSLNYFIRMDQDGIVTAGFDSSDGSGEATISAEAQQTMAANEILRVIKGDAQAQPAAA